MIDDKLDFEGSEETFGKTMGVDLRSSIITAPILYALESSSSLKKVLERRCEEKGDIQLVYECVHSSDALLKTQKLAEKHMNIAIEELKKQLPSSSDVDRSFSFLASSHTVNKCIFFFF